MKLRPDNLRGFILTAETEYEKNILNCFGGLWFTSCHGVGGDMILRITSKDAPLDAWKDSAQPTTAAGAKFNGQYCHNVPIGQSCKECGR